MVPEQIEDLPGEWLIPPEPFKVSLRTKYAINMAYSRAHNVKHLECDYYPCFHGTISDLTDILGPGMLIPHAQATIWVSTAALDEDKAIAGTPTALHEDMKTRLEKGIALSDDQNSDGMVSETGTEDEARAADDSIQDAQFEDDGNEEHVPAADDPSQDAAEVDDDDRDENYEPSHIFFIDDGAVETVARESSRIKKKAAEAQAMGFNLSEGKKLAAKVTEILRKSMKKRRKIRAKKAKAKPAGNEETHSLTSTKHDIGVSKIPDLVVAHVHLKRGSEPKKKDSPDYLAYQLRLGYRVVHICHVIIMENKTGPSRRITDAQELDQEVKGGLIVAQKDLIRQLALHFTQDLCSDQVIAVSAAGLYWRWLLVERRMFAGVPLQSALTFGNNKTEASIPAKHLAPLGKLAKVFQKRPYYVLGTPESDTEWQKLRNDTLIPHLNKHKLYPHTTLVTPKDYSSATPGPSRT